MGNGASMFNTFVGSNAGRGSFPGSYGTFLGFQAGSNAAAGLTNATAIGANSKVGANDSLVLGDSNVNVGIADVTTPTSRLDFQGAMTVRGAAAPALSAGGQGRIYFDSTSNKFQVSQNGGAYQDLVGTVGATSLDGLSDASTNYTTLYNMFLGYDSGSAISSGQHNTSLGYGSLKSLSTGSSNTAVGKYALENVASGNGNTAIGMGSQRSTTGFGNTSVGNQAMNSGGAGNSNTAVGGQSLGLLTTGNNNVAIGSNALQSQMSGSNNVAIGFEALYSANAGDNIAIGYRAGKNITTGTNNLIIGHNAMASSATGSNQLNIGNAIYGDLTTGNIGIGSTNLGAKLEVAGSVKIVDGTQGVGKVLTSDANGLASWAPVTDTLGGLSNMSGASPYWSGAAWACRNVSSANSSSTLVLRDASGDFAANTGTLNVLKVDNGSGAQVSVVTPVAFTSWQLRLPADAGTANQVLKTDGSGNTSWTTITANPGGSSGQIQFNNSSSFAGDSNLNWDNTNKRLGVGTAAPAEALAVNGGVQVGTTASSCTSTNKGTIRYNTTSNVLEFCNGTSWNLVQAAACTDATPNTFTYNDEANTTTATQYSSNILQITGFNCSLPVTLSGPGSPQVQICSDSSCTNVVQGWTAGPTSITSNQYMQLRQTSDAAGGATVTAQVIIGGTARFWNVSNAGGDCVGSTPPVGTVCADGTIYAGLSPDTSAKMFTTRCDYGQTWNGSACTGTRLAQNWNNGTPNWTTTGYTNFNTGQVNSAGLFASADAGSPYAAATTCENLNINGKTDWYLPARNELNVLYVGNATIRNFDTSGSSYWSATESSNDNACYQSFSDGYQNSNNKDGARLVCCVRR